MDTYFTISKDQKPELMEILQNLPGILAGSHPDIDGIGAGFRARIGHTLLDLVAANFDALGRGEAGVDGTIWPPLSKEYLAYQRRFGPNERSGLMKQAGLNPRTNNKGPGAKKGLLTAEQLKLWRRTYADRLAWYMMREPDKVAKAHAAAIAWIVVKKAGAKTMLEVFGNRKVQILVDTGYLRGSLTPGTLTEQGPQALYNPPTVYGGVEQVFEINQPYQIVVGTNVNYAKYHHGEDGNGRRPLWPASFPDDWWNQMLGVAITGLQKINEVFRGTP